MKYIEELIQKKEDLDKAFSLPVKTIAEQIGYTEDQLKSQLLKNHFPKDITHLGIYDLLALSTTTILLTENGTDVGYKLIGIAEEMSVFLPHIQQRAFDYLRMSCFGEVTRIVKYQLEEKERVQNWFNKNYSKVIPEGNLIKFTKSNAQLKALKLKRPDALISIDGIIYPVECKLDFRNYNLKQLRGYMDLIKVDKGYAVAPKFSDSLERSDDIICITSP